MLPDLGCEQVIQELADLGDIPVIILTSKSSEEDRVVGFAFGADDFAVYGLPLWQALGFRFGPACIVSGRRLVQSPPDRTFASDAPFVQTSTGFHVAVSTSDRAFECQRDSGDTLASADAEAAPGV